MGKKFVRLGAGLLVFLLLIVGAEPYMAYSKGEPVKVGVFDMPGFHYYDEEGNLTGYCIDYLNVVARVTGWEYEFVEIKDFMEGCEMLKEQELDLLAPAMMTDARKELYTYSEMSFGTEYTVMLTTPDREDLYYQDYENYNGLTVGVLNGYPMTDYFISKMKIHGFDVNMVYFDTSEESKLALQNGELDALVTSILYYEDEYKVLDVFTPQPFYFMTYKENTELLSELDFAMARVEETYPTLLGELLMDYYPVYEDHFYTREELEYVEKEKVLKVAYVAGRKPLSFTNDKGEFDGISREIFDQIAEYSGLKFEYVELPDGMITYEYLQEQKIDLITGVEYNSANMNSDGVFLSRPYISARKVMVSRPEFVYIPGENYKLAIIEGSKTFTAVLNDKYPHLEIVEYKTVGDCFRAVFAGEADLLLQNQYVVEGVLGKPVYSTFKVIPMEGIEDELCFSSVVPLDGGHGLSESESSVVISLINKAISEITKVEMDSIVMKETLENKYDLNIFDFLYSYRFTITVISIAGVVLLVFGILYRREMKKFDAIREAEARLKEVQQKRYKTIIDCSDDLIYEISLDGESSIGSEKIKEKFGWEIPKEQQNPTMAQAIDILHVYHEDEKIFRQSQLGNGEGAFDDLTLRLCKADGTPVWCRISRTLLMDKNNVPISILGKIVDIDEEMKEKISLEKKSRTDLLTGLLNKQAFEKEVRDYVEEHPSESACFVFIDMDHFKEINDKFGHSVGDQVIRETAKKIQLLFANFDVVGRFGGDEFCVFVKDIPRDTLIDRLKFAVKKMEQEYTYEGGSVRISASIGAAYCRKNTVGYKELMDVADAAAYQAKDNGRNCYIIKDVE